MAINDMFELKHNMSIFGLSVLNVYHAERTNVGEDSQNVSDSFVSTIVNDIRLWQSNAVVNIDVVTQNLGDPTDFHTQSLSSLLGLRTGADMPTFNAGEIRFPRRRTDMRNGFKRYVGMLEVDVNDQDLLPAATDLLDDIGAVLIGDWLSSIDSHHVANYVIIKRVCIETDPVTGKCLKYRLPETDAELVFYEPTTFVTVNNVRSQVSRRARTT